MASMFGEVVLPEEGGEDDAAADEAVTRAR